MDPRWEEASRRSAAFSALNGYIVSDINADGVGFVPRA